MSKKQLTNTTENVRGSAERKCEHNITQYMSAIGNVLKKVRSGKRLGPRDKAVLRTQLVKARAARKRKKR